MMSQYDIEKFDPPPDPDLVCCICQCVLARAVESPCRHVFCQACIERWLTNRRTCPTCRKQTRKEDLKPVLPIVQNMLNRLQMICDFRDNGCLEKVMLEHYERHVRECGYAMTHCRFSKCGITLLKMYVEEHETQLCEHRETACEGECGLMVPLSERPTHNCVLALKTHIDEKNRMIETLKTKLQELHNLSQSLNDQLEQLRNQLDENRPLNRTGGVFSPFPSPFSSSDSDETDFMSDDLSPAFDDTSNMSSGSYNASNSNNEDGNGVDNNVVNDVVNDVVEQVERTVVTSLFDLSSRLERVRNQMRSVLDTGVMSENDNLNDDVLIPSAAAALNAIVGNNTDASRNAGGSNNNGNPDTQPSTSRQSEERRNFASVNFSNPSSPAESHYTDIDEGDHEHENSDFAQHYSDDLDELESNSVPQDTDSNHSDVSDVPLDSDEEVDRSPDPVGHGHGWWRGGAHHEGHVVMSDPPDSPSNSSVSEFSSSSIPTVSSLHSPRIDTNSLSPPTSPGSSVKSGYVSSKNASTVSNSPHNDSDSIFSCSSNNDNDNKDDATNSNAKGSLDESCYSVSSSVSPKTSPAYKDSSPHPRTDSKTSVSDDAISESGEESETTNSPKSNHCESNVFEDEDSDHERAWSNTTADESGEYHSDGSNEPNNDKGSVSDWKSMLQHDADHKSDSSSNDSDTEEDAQSEVVPETTSKSRITESCDRSETTRNVAISSNILYQSDSDEKKVHAVSRHHISSSSSDDSESMKYLTKRIKRVKQDKTIVDTTKETNVNLHCGHSDKNGTSAAKSGVNLKRKRDQIEDAMSQHACKKLKGGSQTLSSSEPIAKKTTEGRGHLRRGRSCTAQSSNANQDNSGQSLNVKIDLSLINYSGQLVPCPTSNAATNCNTTVIHGRANLSPHHPSSTVLQHDPETAVLVHCSSAQSHKPGMAKSAEAQLPSNHLQSRYPIRRRGIQDSGRSTNVMSSVNYVSNVHNHSPSNREFPYSWNDDSDSESDKTWEPDSDHGGESDASVTDEDVDDFDSDESYTVEVPKTIGELLDECASDDSDDSWTVGMN